MNPITLKAFCPNCGYDAAPNAHILYEGMFVVCGECGYGWYLSLKHPKAGLQPAPPTPNHSLDTNAEKRYTFSTIAPLIEKHKNRIISKNIQSRKPSISPTKSPKRVAPQPRKKLLTTREVMRYSMQQHREKVPKVNNQPEVTEKVSRVYKQPEGRRPRESDLNPSVSYIIPINNQVLEVCSAGVKQPEAGAASNQKPKLSSEQPAKALRSSTERFSEVNANKDTGAEGPLAVNTPAIPEVLPLQTSPPEQYAITKHSKNIIEQSLDANTFVEAVAQKAKGKALNDATLQLLNSIKSSNSREDLSLEFALPIDDANANPTQTSIGITSQGNDDPTEGAQPLLQKITHLSLQVLKKLLFVIKDYLKKCFTRPEVGLQAFSYVFLILSAIGFSIVFKHHVAVEKGQIGASYDKDNSKVITTKDHSSGTPQTTGAIMSLENPSLQQADINPTDAKNQIIAFKKQETPSDSVKLTSLGRLKIASKKVVSHISTLFNTQYLKLKTINTNMFSKVAVYQNEGRWQNLQDRTFSSSVTLVNKDQNGTHLIRSLRVFFLNETGKKIGERLIVANELMNPNSSTTLHLTLNNTPEGTKSTYAFILDQQAIK